MKLKNKKLWMFLSLVPIAALSTPLIASSCGKSNTKEEEFRYVWKQLQTASPAEHEKLITRMSELFSELSREYQNRFPDKRPTEQETRAWVLGLLNLPSDFNSPFPFN